MVPDMAGVSVPIPELSPAWAIGIHCTRNAARYSCDEHGVLREGDHNPRTAAFHHR